ncbi:MAG: dockerin type I domain-containing protein, partial [candidate division KSB1 bacterium]|nr:dockerin type I domain-containing protein [candidate division KSB1 bacterium]
MQYGRWAMAILFLLLIGLTSGGAQNNQPATGGTLVPSASFLGKHYIERIGYALAGGGDVNGDGFDDFLIGTFHNAVMGSDAGAAYLFLGRERLPWGLNCSIDSADARMMGKQAYDAAGYSVACNGDLNGDGLADMIIGAPAGNDKVPWMTGRIYIVFGKATADWGYYYRLDDACDVIYEGENNQDQAGLSVAYIGDVNHDGYDDFICGAPLNDQSALNGGKVYLILGHANPWKRMNYLTNVAAAFSYSREKAEAGYSVAGIGDVNDDGTPDFAIGAFGASRVFIIYGRPRITWGQNFDLDEADLILRSRAFFFDDGLGWKLAGGGDLNGDGVPDMAFSAIHDDLAGTRAGKVFVLFGKKGGWENRELILEDLADASFVGEMPLDQAGWGLGFAGDMNSDGFDDLLIGCYKDDKGPINGKAYLIRGQAAGWKKNVSLLSIPDYCERQPEGIGFAVSTAGDFDGDGVADFVISAPFNSDVQQWNGKVYLFASQQIPYRVSGRVRYWRNQRPIPEAILQSDSAGAVRDTTDVAGGYELLLRGKGDHLVSISKQMGQHVGNAISAYDAALIAQLAIQLIPPDTVNKLAADVNRDGQCTMYDAANALRYAVQLPPLNDSHAGEWEFIPANMCYDSIVADQFDQNYHGFVRGDVDGNWQFPGTVIAKPTHNLDVSCLAVGKGEEFSIPISCASDLAITSLDLEVSFDQQVLELVSWENASLLSDFNTLANDQIRNRFLLAAYRLQPKTHNGALL